MISLDAAADGDVDFLLRLPNFSSLCSQGTLVRDVESVFISNTYPAHASIITGVHPNNHGIYENFFWQAGKAKRGWRRFAKDITAPTLYDKAAEHGKAVCSIFYPGTCGAKIRWNLAEIPDKMNVPEKAARMLFSGGPSYFLSALLGNIKHLKGFSEPELDDFLAQTAAYSIKRYKPDLLLLHLIDLDDHKHRFGPDSAEAKEALRRLDRRLATVLDAARGTWPEEDTSVIVFSDHGCLPVHTAVDPNDYLKKCGLIRKSGKKEDFDAFFHDGGGTAFLKIINPSKREEAMRAVSDMVKEPFCARLLTAEEMAVSGLDKEFDCGIEAADGYCFGKPEKGQHGYGLKREGYRPFYLAVGAGIAKGEVKKGGCIVDICPLAAELLGIPLWKMDGINRIKGR